MNSVNAHISHTLSALNAAKIITEERLAQFPKYPPYIHAVEQVGFIARILDVKRGPTPHENQHIDIGLMAVKEFDALDPEYAVALSELSFRFKKPWWLHQVLFRRAR